MAFLDKNGLQVLTNKLVQGDAIKVASHRGHTVQNVIDNITRECENIATPNTMTLENRVSEFKVGKGRDVDVSGDVEEGKIEVELQGKTWQNVVHGKKSVQSNIFTIEDGKYVFNNNATSSGGIIFSLICKPNTTYTLIINFLECALGDNTLYIDGHPVYLSTTNKNLPKTKGTHAIRFVTKDDVTDKKMKLAIFSSSTSKLVIDENIIVLEGDYTQTPIEELPKYFEGIKSSFEDGVVDVDVQGKNLFDCDRELTNYGSTSYEKIPNGYRIKRDTPGRYSNSYIIMNLKPNTKYLIHSKYTLRTGSAMIIIKDKNNDSFPNRQEPFMSNNMVGSFVTPDDGVVRLGFACTTNTETLGDVDFYDILLQEYTESSYSHYEPYYKKKISFNIGEPLINLPNGVCDEIRNNKGQWELVRRVGKLVFDGTENWASSGTPPDDTNFKRFDLTLSNTLKKGDGVKLLCNNLPHIYIHSLPNGSRSITQECISHHSVNIDTTNVVLKTSTIGGNSVTNFKQYLSNNPLVVYYELQSPIITPIEPMEFDVKPLATMTINSDIAPVSNHKVVLNRAGQIEQGIVQIAELKKRVDSLETAYDSYLLETQHKLSILGFEYELESEEV